jgi:hypothetical protein
MIPNHYVLGHLKGRLHQWASDFSIWEVWTKNMWKIMFNLDLSCPLTLRTLIVTNHMSETTLLLLSPLPICTSSSSSPAAWLESRFYMCFGWRCGEAWKLHFGTWRSTEVCGELSRSPYCTPRDDNEEGPQSWLTALVVWWRLITTIRWVWEVTF